MNPLWIILLLAGIGVVLLIGELLLPTHGVLAVTGLLCIGCGIGVVFRVSEKVGVLMLLAALVASPFLLTAAMKVWQRSPVGRRLILQPVDLPRAPLAVSIGQIGLAVTDLRPMGECEFGALRLEAVAQLGIIAAGKHVKVVAIDNGRLTVKELGKET